MEARPAPEESTSAQRWALLLTEAFNAGDGDTVTSLMADDFVEESRRSIVGYEFERDESIADLDVVMALADAPRLSRTDIAKAGDLVSVGGMALHYDEGAVSDGVVLGVWGVDGLMQRMILFDPDQIAEALIAAAHWSGERVVLLDQSVREAACGVAAFPFVVAWVDAHNAGRIDDFVAVLADDFMHENRRAMLTHQLDKRAYSGSSRVLAEQIAGGRIEYEFVAHAGEHALMARGSINYEAYESPFLALGQWTPGGKLRRQVMFDVEDVELALLELENLGGAPAVLLDPSLAAYAASGTPAGSGDVDSGLRMTAVQQIIARWRELQKLGEPERIGEVLQPDVVLEDRRSVVSAGTVEGLSAFVELELAARSSGLVPDDAAHPLALRGEDHALARVDLVGDSGERVERIVLFSLGPTGLVARVVVFDVSDLDDAFNELDRCYLESLEPHQGKLFELGEEISRAILVGDVVAIREYCSEDLACIDHRALRHMEMSFEDYLSLVAMRPEIMGPGSFETRDHQFIGPEVVLTIADFRTTSPDHGVEAVDTPLSVVQWQGGKAIRHEIYEVDQRDQALARAQELAQTIGVRSHET